jgi:hypothetical protein
MQNLTNADSPPCKQIICIKWGNRYGPEYVNRIYAMTARFTTPPFALYCFTDDSVGIRPEITCLPLPELGCEHPLNTPGKWRKTALWGDTLYGITGTCLYIDLDSVITRSLDEFFELGNPEDVYMARNWVKPFSGMGQSSVFRFTVGAHSYILNNFRANPQELATKYQFEQHYTTSNLKNGIKFWPHPLVVHFRRHCLGIWPLRYLRPAKLHPKTIVVTFPSKPDPEDAILGRWDDSYTSGSRWQHIKSVLKSKYPLHIKYRRLKRYVFPVAWVKEFWRE